MRNHYTFKGLKAESLLFHDNEADAFFSMHDYIKDLSPSAYPQTEDMLAEFLTYDMYYVAHNYLVHKGKQSFFKGRIVAARRDDLFDFIRDTVANDDLRPLLIAPVFKNIPEQVISFSENGYYVYHL